VPGTPHVPPAGELATLRARVPFIDQVRELLGGWGAVCR
jgi:hypothetical protein